MVANKSFIFKAIPSGYPIAGQDLTVEERPLDLDSVQLQDDEMLVQNLYISLDPYQRLRMYAAPTPNDDNAKSSTTTTTASAADDDTPYTLGEPLENFTVSRVLRCATGKTVGNTAAVFKPGDLIHSVTSSQEYSIVRSSSSSSGAGNMGVAVTKIENPLSLDLKYFLGPLGMPGMTAYSGYYEVARGKKGETILISAAAGAVGQMVGQLAKRDGLRVIGSVGDDAKLEYIQNQLGFDAGFNYKKERPAAALQRLAPHGIDVYFENVGGEHFEAALDALNPHGRIVACGMVSQYNLAPSETYHVKNLGQIDGKRLKIEGFNVLELWEKYSQQFHADIQHAIHNGSLRVSMAETRGIENAPAGFVGLLKGANFGKAVVTVNP